MNEADGPRAKRPPKERTAEEWDELARKVIGDQLGARARTRHELELKLAHRGVPEAISFPILERFTELGYIDDAAFAHAWVAGKFDQGGVTGQALALDLKRKGVSDDLIREALATISTDDERDKALELVTRKYRGQVTTLPRAKATARLASMLARKGFGPGMAFDVVKGFLNEHHNVA